MDPKPKRKSKEVAAAERDTTEAIFFGPKRTRPKSLGDQLGQLFLAWAWHAGHGWEPSLRTLARALRGLAGEGLVERQRTRGTDGQVLHLVRLTPLGTDALALLAGKDSEAAR